MVLLLALAAATSLAMAAFAIALALRQRAIGEELNAVRAELAASAERLRAIERCASGAAERADAARALLLEKGVADEGDLEAARRAQIEDADGASEPGDAPPAPGRGPRTLH